MKVGIVEKVSQRIQLEIDGWNRCSKARRWSQNTLLKDSRSIVVYRHFGRSVGVQYPTEDFRCEFIEKSGGGIDNRDGGSRARCRLAMCVPLSGHNKNVIVRVVERRGLMDPQ